MHRGVADMTKVVVLSKTFEEGMLTVRDAVQKPISSDKFIM